MERYHTGFDETGPVPILRKTESVTRRSINPKAINKNRTSVEPVYYQVDALTGRVGGRFVGTATTIPYDQWPGFAKFLEAVGLPIQPPVGLFSDYYKFDFDAMAKLSLLVEGNEAAAKALNWPIKPEWRPFSRESVWHIEVLPIRRAVRILYPAG